MAASNYSRRDVLRAGAAGLATCLLGRAFAAPPPAASTKPNVIVILADDMGWGDVSCYPQDRTQPGAPIRTPNIDSLAGEGVRFTQAYATGPVCTPARAGLLAGRYQQSFGWYEFVEAELGFPKDVLLLPQFMQQQGYATACIGKWHVGKTDALGPLHHGFDRFYGVLGGQHDYFDSRLGDPTPGVPYAYDQWVRDQERHVEQMGYLTDELTNHALAFIEQQAAAARPFFLYLPYNAPHSPFQVPWERLAPYADAEGHFTLRDITRAMIDVMDEGIGRILQRLLHLGIDENTLIVFSSDNGGVENRDGQPMCTHNGGLRPRKGFLWEGGIRVPLIMRWPGHVAEGQVYRQPVSHLDLFATIAAAVAPGQAAPAKLDGVDLLPYLNGTQAGLPHESLFWGFQPEHRRYAARHGQWKLVHDIVDYKAEQEKPARFELALHDIERDPEERHNVADAHPEIVADLQGRWEKFIAACPPSFFGPGDRKRWWAEVERRRAELPNANELGRNGSPGHWLK